MQRDTVFSVFKQFSIWKIKSKEPANLETAPQKIALLKNVFSENSLSYKLKNFEMYDPPLHYLAKQRKVTCAKILRFQPHTGSFCEPAPGSRVRDVPKFQRHYPKKSASRILLDKSGVFFRRMYLRAKRAAHCPPRTRSSARVATDCESATRASAQRIPRANCYKAATCYPESFGPFLTRLPQRNRGRQKGAERGNNSLQITVWICNRVTFPK